MKRRVLLSAYIFCFFILIFFLQKIIFVMVHAGSNGGVMFSDVLDILYHGLPLDMSMSGYYSVFPFLLLLVSVWVKPKSLAKVYDAYYIVILAITAIITLTDVVLYTYWGYHFDSSVFMYLQNPKEAFASTTYWQLGIVILLTLLLFTVLYYGYIYMIRKPFLNLHPAGSKTIASIVLFILSATLFLPIRGGTKVSTMNVGYAYYSERMFLNHAAVNPAFNLMYSMSKSDDFASQYQFYAENNAMETFRRMNEQPANDSIPQLLNADRPNIIIFLMESFSYDAALDPVIAPNMCRLSEEGVLFTHFYANSFRTDRGLVSVLSGYPAQPTASILKYPQKTVSLPAIPKSLKQVGYKNQSMYYGGDINFTNMRSYFIGGCGIDDIIADREFPLKDRMTKWGVPDEVLVGRVFDDLKKESQDEPFLKIVLTLSSHEPFDVPNDRFDVPFLNSVNYADECIGNFMTRLKETELWDNTLVVFIADHAMQDYPHGTQNHDEARFHIPMVWSGGAVKQPMVISDYGSQNDFSATLLSQLGVDSSEFPFSKNMLNPDSRKFAFYSYVNGFSMIDTTGVYMYDNDQQKTLKETGNPNQEKEAKSQFQMMYLDLGRR